MSLVEIKVPDIGDYKNIPVIEILVAPGDSVTAEDPLMTLESDKATMEVPAPMSGVVRELKVKIGDKVSEGVLVMTLETVAVAASTEAAATKPASSPSPSPVTPVQAKPAALVATPPVAPRTVVAAPAPLPVIDEAAARMAHAGPSVRRFARELGVDISKVAASGPKNRILREDVQAYVKAALARPAGGSGLGFNLPPMTPVDFSKFGPVETQALSRIKKLSGAFLHRNWLSIPHITQNDEADITELEAFRKSQADEALAAGVKFTLLGFLIKAVVVALKECPHFNASLSPDGESLVLKQYFHIGVAVDTPNGLVVPVIRDADKKGLREIAKELGEVSTRMRNGKINPADLQGGCFSISSLGGLGGTHFTPIINAPEVAILGVGKAAMRPVWDGKQFVPRLMLPLSLSYDHRVIDGAQGARFISFLGSVLSDIRRLAL